MIEPRHVNKHLLHILTVKVQANLSRLCSLGKNLHYLLTLFDLRMGRFVGTQ